MDYLNNYFFQSKQVQLSINNLILMQKDLSKRQSTLETSHKLDVEETIGDIFALFEALFSHRLIDKICRPIENKLRLEIIAEYKQKFNDLHSRMDTLKKLTTISKQNGIQNTKNDEKTTKAHKNFDLKNQIRKIETKYIELFRDGSFKHYDRVSKLYGLPENLYVINIENWAVEILSSNNQKKNCC